MRIATYRELQSKDELLPLFQHAHWWAFSPKEFEKTIKADPRLGNSPVGYAAIKGNHLVGFVGVMDIVARTTEGSDEKVGGVWGVVTHPAHARKGIFTALMQKSHEYFKEQGYKFSLLNTSKSLIAYAFYQKLGYRGVTGYPSAYKVVKQTRKTERKSGKKNAKLDWSGVLEMFNHVMKDRSGFVVRSTRYRKMLETRRMIQPKKCVVTGKGYALLNEDKGNVSIREIVASTKEEVSKLITHSESKATKTVIAEVVIDNTLRRAYQSHRFMILEDSYDLLMYKPLTNASFMEVYGNKFYAAATDYF